MTTKVEAIKHKDVRGNILHYLKIATEIGEILINVGQKTHDKIIELHTPKPLPNEPTTKQGETQTKK